MLARVPVSESAATFTADISGNDSEFSDMDVSSAGFAYFSDMLRKLFPGKTAAIVHYLTGISERHAYRLAGGASQPSGEAVIRFLRSSEGGRVLDYVMAGCKALWWQRHLEDRRYGARGREFVHALRGDGVQLDLPL